MGWREALAEGYRGGYSRGYGGYRGGCRGGYEGGLQSKVQPRGHGTWGGGGGGLAESLGIMLFAFGGACWLLAIAHSDPLWFRTCFGCVNGAPG